MATVVHPVSDLLPGVEFGGYIVRELIGSGAMASVYRAEHVMLRKPVALKVMDRSLLAQVGGRERFLREGRAVAAIKHPNVVNITDLGVHDQVPYLVMELLTGEDLQAHLLQREPLADTAAVRLALPVIAALSAAHNCGIVHRDVKPSNIFLSLGPSGEVVPKVLDFGISRISFDHTGRDLVTTPHDQIIGTPMYLAPEALSGQSLGPAADQYSLGVVLYECVTGRTPYGGDSLASLFGSLSRGEFERPSRIRSGISPALERVILTAMSPDPADRYPELRDMGNALIDLAAERTQVVWGNSFRSPEAQARSLSRGPQPIDAPSSALPGAPSPPAAGGGQRRVPMVLGLCAMTLAAAAAWSFVAGRGSQPASAVHDSRSAEVSSVSRATVADRALPPANPSTTEMPVQRPASENDTGAHGVSRQKESVAEAKRVAVSPPPGPVEQGAARQADRRGAAQSVANAVQGRIMRRAAPRSSSPSAAGPSTASRAAAAVLPARSDLPVAPRPARELRRGANGAPFLD